METETKKLIEQFRRRKKIISKLEKVDLVSALKVSLCAFKRYLDQFEEQLLENPEAVPQFMNHQAYYVTKCREVYS